MPRWSNILRAGRDDAGQDKRIASCCSGGRARGIGLLGRRGETFVRIPTTDAGRDPDRRPLRSRDRPASAAGTAHASAAATAHASATGTGPAWAAGTGPPCLGHRATLVGTNGDDVIVGTPHQDVIVARAGNDVVRSRSGMDIVCGGPGNDRLFGGNNRDRLAGDEGADTIVDRGAGFRDLLLGGPGDDLLMSARGGYADSRTLRGGPGADRLIDVGSFESSMEGGTGPDTLTSEGHNDTLAGGPGTDVLTLAGTGDTVLDLTADGDQVRLRRADEIVLLCQGARGPLDIDLIAGTIRRVGAAAGDVITNIGKSQKWPPFEVYGTAGNDRISGRDDSGLLFGDSLWGLGGNDVLYGRGGGDLLEGGRGDDFLDGGYGHDSANGGEGNDTCTNAGQVEGCSP